MEEWVARVAPALQPARRRLRLRFRHCRLLLRLRPAQQQGGQILLQLAMQLQTLRLRQGRRAAHWIAEAQAGLPVPQSLHPLLQPTAAAQRLQGRAVEQGCQPRQRQGRRRFRRGELQLPAVFQAEAIQ